MHCQETAHRVVAPAHRALGSRRGVVFLCALLTGCMTVQIESGDSQIKMLHHVGFLQIELPQSDKAIVGALYGVGIVATPMGWSAGYTRQRWAAIGPQCRAVLWVNGTVDASVRRDLEQVAGVCLVEDDAAVKSEQNSTTEKEKGQ